MKISPIALASTAFLVSFLSIASASTKDAEVPATSVEDYSYQIAVQVTTQVRQQLNKSGLQLDNAAFLRGVQDVLADGKKPDVSKESE